MKICVATVVEALRKKKRGDESQLDMNNDSGKLLVPNWYTINVRMHKSFVLIFLPSLTGDVSVMAWFQEIPSFYLFLLR